MAAMPRRVAPPPSRSQGRTAGVPRQPSPRRGEGADRVHGALCINHIGTCSTAHADARAGAAPADESSGAERYSAGRNAFISLSGGKYCAPSAYRQSIINGLPSFTAVRPTHVPMVD
jgi:hypothetical protein